MDKDLRRCRYASLVSGFILLLANLSFAAPENPGRRFDSLRMMPVSSEQAFQDSVAPGTLRYACLGSLTDLQMFFQEKDLPFDSKLVREREGLLCHLFFEPTIPGFRADPDNQPVTGLYSDIHTLSFLSLRDKPLGDSLDVLKSVLAQVKRPLEVTIGVVKSHEKSWYDEAKRFHFPGTSHRIILEDDAGMEGANPWVQDYLKSGHAGEERKTLVTRSLIEGNLEDGFRHRPLVRTFSDPSFVRSKLSWEGGDLQFVVHPRFPDEVVLCYGSAARKYWGANLSPAEYAYVLKLEFGADHLLDLSNLALHVDYVVSFLPRFNAALVAQPVRENYELAKAASRLFHETFGHLESVKQSDLERLLSGGEKTFTREKKRIQDAISQLRASEKRWQGYSNRELETRLYAYVEKHCPEDWERCLNHEGQKYLLSSDRDLLKEWVTGLIENWAEPEFAVALLALIESQLPGAERRKDNQIDGVVKRLQGLGFRVIRVPSIGGNFQSGVSWWGIDYVNSLLVDNRLFVPEFGLGAPEFALFEELRKRLPSSIRLTPVYARHVMIHSGGIHCTLAIFRGR